MQQAAGYPIENLLKTVLPSELICKICQNLMRDPVNCISCKIWICLSCSQAA